MQIFLIRFYHIVITDSGGASATIVKSDVATATSSVDVNTTITGQYAGIESLLGESNG